MNFKELILLEILRPEEIKNSDRHHSELIKFCQKSNWQCNNCSAFVYKIEVYYRKENRKLLYVPLMINSHGEETRATIDHIIPRSRGGINKHQNKQLLCEICNHHKGNKILTERNRNELHF